MNITIFKNSIALERLQFDLTAWFPSPKLTTPSYCGGVVFYL